MKIYDEQELKKMVDIKHLFKYALNRLSDVEWPEG